MATITWLHLSDLHFQQREHWDEDVVLKALLKDVRKRVAQEGLRPDLVLVSGDIAFDGKEEEYALARVFFDELLEAVGRAGEKECLLVVPGNHDVDRPEKSSGAFTLAAALDTRDKVNGALDDPDSRLSLFRKLREYANFVCGYFAGHRTFDDERYFYVQTFDLAGRRVAVLGLNSAWRSLDDQDRARGLLLGERQVRGALRQAEGADLKIALLHHPLEWLADSDRSDCEALLLDNCHFVLHGHLHRTAATQLITPDSAATVLAGGACYETRTYPNMYNWVQLDLEKGQGTVYLRAYSDRCGGFWTKDTATYKNVPDGRYTFRLPQAGAPAEEKQRLAVVAPAVDAALLEKAYLRRVLVSCNSLPLWAIDPRAVERTMPRTMELLPVYVALNTTTAVPQKGRRRKQGTETGWLGMEPSPDTRPLPALEAVARKERRVVLLGDPGSGKSTFANYLALCLAGAWLEEQGRRSDLPGQDFLSQLKPAWKHGPLLPVQVALRRFAASNRCDGSATGLQEFIDDTLAEQDLAEFAPILRQRLLEGGVLVLLDGLDEVADEKKRQAVRQAVADFAAAHDLEGNRFLVTCRGYAYQAACDRLEGFAAHTLAPFTQEQIDRFIGCWYEEVCPRGWKSAAEAEELVGNLRDSARRPDLAPLASNPLQLTMMASLHFSWGRLPQDRAELYQQMVELLLVRWQESRLGVDTGVSRWIDRGKLESAMEEVGFVAHRAQAGPQGAADIGEAVLLGVLKGYTGGDWGRAQAVARYIRERAGLLIERGPGVYTFPHRSYQEYLAGAYLARQPDFADQAAGFARENYAQWRQVVLWVAAIRARLMKLIYDGVNVADALCPRQVPAGTVPEVEWRAAALAGEVLLETGLAEVQARERYRPVLERVRDWLVALVTRDLAEPPDRAAAGRVLARLGDPRRGVGVLPTSPLPLPPPHSAKRRGEGERGWGEVGLPDLLWCPVPADSFLMGTCPEDIPELVRKYGGERCWYEWETPQHPVDLAAYYIARYPVTNAQFEAFVEAGGYRKQRYWREAEDTGVWSRKGVKGWGEGEPRQGPADFGDLFNLPSYPVVGVSWYEALAYSRWLDEQCRKAGRPLLVWRDGQVGEVPFPAGAKVCLPSEAQWEKAARGTDGRQFPWGDEFNPYLANVAETGIHSTSAVGCFPGGAGPYGAEDMAGNVWEWCLTRWREDYHQPEDNDPAVEVVRVLRGGSFSINLRNARCAARGGRRPIGWPGGSGFRLVLVAPA